jgi:hypothetical protein
MENLSSAQTEQVRALLAQRVENHRTDLVDRYFSVLRESLFSSRAEVRPNALKQIAADEVETLLSFLRQPGSSAGERGEQLHQAGFHVRALLRLSQVTRQFLLTYSENGQSAPTLDVIDAYEMALIEGFIKSMDDTNKIERAQLERVLTALQQRGDN